MPQVSNSIRALRAQQGLTQEGLAQQVGGTRQTIIAIEANKYSPSLTLAFEIARVLKVTINDVFNYT